MNLVSRRRMAAQLLGLAAALTLAFPAAAHDAGPSLRSGKVFTSTNAPGRNELLVYAPTASGDLALVARADTQGQGTGAGLGSQGAVALSGDGGHVFVVNALSNTLSVFRLTGKGAVLSAVVDSGGLTPISVSESNGLVAVLNAGGAGNVSVFRHVQGQLQPVPGGTRPLSAAGGTGPAQVGFGADGEVLVVTEKTTSRITSYNVRPDGSLSAPIVSASSGAVPFGFAFDKRDHLIVSEAVASAASSYRFAEQGPAVPQLISASVPNTQAAACWVAITPNGKFAYTANAGTSSISSYRIDRTGHLTLSQAAAGSTGANAGATDMAITPDGHHLYGIAPRSLQIVSFTVSHDGGLTTTGAATGLPAGFAGLAAN